MWPAPPTKACSHARDGLGRVDAELHLARGVAQLGVQDRVAGCVGRVHLGVVARDDRRIRAGADVAAGDGVVEADLVLLADIRLLEAPALWIRVGVGRMETAGLRVGFRVGSRFGLSGWSDLSCGMLMSQNKSGAPSICQHPVRRRVSRQPNASRRDKQVEPGSATPWTQTLNSAVPCSRPGQLRQLSSRHLPPTSQALTPHTPHTPEIGTCGIHWRPDSYPALKGVGKQNAGFSR